MWDKPVWLMAQNWISNNNLNPKTMSIYSTAVNKPISTLMIFLAILVLGVASYIQLPVDQFPKMDPPYLTVMATYPGANASDIEENVTKILEDQLNSVDELKELISTSYDNLAVISLEFFFIKASNISCAECN